MPTVFISYRRDDAAGHAGRLADALRARFGPDFVQVLNRAILEVQAVLAVIGHGWLHSRNRQGHRRLDDPNDFVRLEIGWALSRGIDVIPVLVQGATMPQANDLPPSIRRLTGREAIELRDTRWRVDVEDLCRTVEMYAYQPIGQLTIPWSPPPVTNPSTSQIIQRALHIVAVVAACSLAFTFAAMAAKMAQQDALRSGTMVQSPVLYELFLSLFTSVMCTLPNYFLVAHSKLARCLLIASSILGAVFSIAFPDVSVFSFKPPQSVVVVLGAAGLIVGVCYLAGLLRILRWVVRRL